jgi:hypothetical protein
MKAYVVTTGILSSAIEHPDVVLVVVSSAKPLHGAKTAAGIDQLVPKGDRRLTVRMPGLKRDHKSVSIPLQTGDGSAAFMNALDITSV